MKLKFCPRIAGNSEAKANGDSLDMTGWAHEKEFRMEKSKFGLPRMKKRGRTETFCVNILERNGTQGFRPLSGSGRVAHEKYEILCSWSEL